MPKRNYTIFCDESSKKGPLFSNFYGGVLVRSQDRQAIEASLAAKKEELNLYREIKWTKITDGYKEKYIEFIEYYFSFVETGRLKVRIMFTQNMHRAKNLTQDQIDNQYFLLYYQMIKHSFGLAYCNPNALDRVYFSILLDEIPHKAEKKESFINYISGIDQTQTFHGRQVFIPKSDIGDVDSKDHNILQGLDIVLGSMQFRLNKLHLEKPVGQRFRAKRTRAKEAVYQVINRKIRGIYPQFNIGTSTGTANGPSDRWNHPYRHWLFKPADRDTDKGG